MFYLWFDPGISVSNIKMISPKSLRSQMCLILKRQGEPQGKWRWWGAVPQQQQWISREEEAEVLAPGKTGDPAWDGCPSVVPTAASTGHWDVLQGSGWTPRCHKHQVQGRQTSLVRTSLKSFVDSVPSPLGQHSTASTISLSFLPVNYCLLHNMSFQYLQWMKWVPWGEKKVL